MSTLETEKTSIEPPTVTTRPGPPPRRRKSAFGRSVLLLLLAGAAGGAFYSYIVNGRVRNEVDRTISYVRQDVPKEVASPPVSAPTEPKKRQPWDGFVKVEMDEAKNLGLEVVAVQPQVNPIKLELPGRTDYDPNTLNKIRPRFDTLVERVRAELGQKVK